MKLRWGMVLVMACCGSPAERFCDRRAACLKDTGIDVIDATRDVDWCVPKLERSIPDGAIGDLEACASCLEDASCEQIALSHCTSACAAVRSAIQVPGTLTGEGGLAASCTSELLDNSATEQALTGFGQLAIELECGGSSGAGVFILPEQAGGAELRCGEMYVRDESGAASLHCSEATGTIAERAVDGRDWFAGQCTCDDVTVSFDVPYRFAGWVISTSY